MKRTDTADPGQKENCNGIKGEFVDILKVPCSNHKESCEWVGKHESLKEHLDLKCDYVLEKCPFKCVSYNDRTHTLFRKNKLHHVTNECKLRPYQCKYCGEKYSFAEIELCHHSILCNSCPEFPLECTNSCGK